MKAQPLALLLAAEALGTFLFFSLGFNAVAVAIDLAGGSISPLGVAFGLGLTAAVAALGHVCLAFVPRPRSEGWPRSIRTAAARRCIVASRVD
jgi:hypothetical protein